MLPNNAQSHPSVFDISEPNLRFGKLLGEVWQDWFETLSQVAYRTHRACEFLAENGMPSNGRYGLFDFPLPRSRSEGSDGSVDMHKLRQCLQAMDPTQAAQVMHAVQSMQAMEAMLKRQQSRENEAERAAW